MFTPAPPAETQVCLRVLRCDAFSHLDVIVCNARYVGVMTHWIDGTTILHSLAGTCEGCDARQSPRWQGYLIVQSMESGLHRLLQFTPPVAHTLDAHQNAGHDLAGAVVRLKREGKNRNSPLYARVMSKADHFQQFEFARLQEAVAKLFRQDFPLFEAARKDIGCLPVE